MNVLYALATSLLFAGTTVLSKVLSADIPSFIYAFVRNAIAVACLLPFISYDECKKVGIKHLFGLIFLGLMIAVIVNSLFFTALAYTSPLTISLIMCMHPIVTLLVTSALSLQIPKKNQILACILCFFGAALVISKGQLGAEIFKGSIGEFIAVGSLFCHVAYTLVLKRMSHHYSSTFLTFSASLVGVVMILAMSFNMKFVHALSTLNHTDWAIFTYIGCLGTALALIFFSLSIKNMGAPMASLVVLSGQPIFVFIISWLLLGDTITIWQAVGGALVIASLFWALKKS